MPVSRSFGSALQRRQRATIPLVFSSSLYHNKVVVDESPCLERLLFQTIADRRPVKIVHEPRLGLLGFLDLQLHVLAIGGVVIRAGTRVRASAMVPSLKILAVRVRFSHDWEAKMLPTLLKCFPRLETLHIMSVPSESPDSIHGRTART